MYKADLLLLLILIIFNPDASPDQIQDKKATAHPSVVSSLTNEVVNGTKVVIDGKLITSRGLSTVTEFALAIISKLFGHARARSVAEGLVYDYPRS